MAKTGLFFANADGIYSEKERDYITGFVSGIEQIGDIPAELKGAVYDTLNHQYQLDEIMNETDDLVKDFSDQERKAILYSINDFIGKVIKADGKVHPLEKESYKQWKLRFGIA